MIFGPILFIHSLQYSLLEYQSIKMMEMPSHRSRFNFPNLCRHWVLARFGMAYSFAYIYILFLSFLHHTWCNPTQGIHHFTMHIDLSTIWCLLTNFHLDCSFDIQGQFLSLNYLTQVITHHSIWYSFVAITFSVTENFIICCGTMAQSISCLIWLAWSIFNIKINTASLLSNLIWATPNLISLTYARGLLSVYIVNLEPKR